MRAREPFERSRNGGCGAWTATVGRGVAILTIGLWAGCGDMGTDPGATDPGPLGDPTWTGGVKAVLTARCASCHGDPPRNGAPSGFRLDRYDRADAGGTVDGAVEVADRIRVRAVEQETMPPGGPLPSDERDLLEEWIAAGTPYD